MDWAKYTLYINWTGFSGKRIEFLAEETNAKRIIQGLRSYHAVSVRRNGKPVDPNTLEPKQAVYRVDQDHSGNYWEFHDIDELREFANHICSHLDITVSQDGKEMPECEWKQ